MARVTIAFLLVALTGTPVLAQAPLAEQMTCQQAKDYFAQYRIIYKRAHGQVLPIRQGIPLSEPLFCAGPNRYRFTYGLQTLDSRRCVISHYCSGN